MRQQKSCEIRETSMNCGEIHYLCLTETLCYYRHYTYQNTSFKFQLTIVVWNIILNTNNVFTILVVV